MHGPSMAATFFGASILLKSFISRLVAASSDSFLLEISLPIPHHTTYSAQGTLGDQRSFIRNVVDGSTSSHAAFILRGRP